MPGCLCYLLGASHSGTTLLAMLLGAHRDCCTVGQLGADGIPDPERYRCSCGRRIGECSFWSEVSARMRGRGVDFDIANPGTSIHALESNYLRRLLSPLHRGPVLEAIRDAALTLSARWRSHLASTQRRYAALVNALGEVSRAKVIVDSSKTGVRLKYLLRNPDLEVKVIWVIRDGRGVALTYLDPLNFADARSPELRAGGFGGGRDGEQKPIARAAREWRRSNEEAECVVANLSRSRWMLARYEDVCSNTHATLRSICAFLGLAPECINLDFRSRTQHVVGNGMRLDSSPEIRLDERWRQHFGINDLAVFDRIAGNLNRRYGYI